MTTLCGPHQRLVPTDLPMQHDFLSNFIDFNYWIAPTELRIQVDLWQTGSEKWRIITDAFVQLPRRKRLSGL